MRKVSVSRAKPEKLIQFVCTEIVGRSFVAKGFFNK